MLAPAVRDYIETNHARFLDDLKQFLTIPSISALPDYRPEMRRAAAWLLKQLREQIGMEAGLIESDGHPLVYGEWLHAPGKPTVLLYGHYDVQPVDPLELWRTPPFEPTVEGDNLRARGAVDDKGPTLAALKALETLMQTHGHLPVNVKVLLEGEEESGGQAIAAYVSAYPQRLQADCALVLDTGMVAPGIPTLTHALRGITYAEIVARGAASDLHSGVYGGIAPNPLQALAWVLADLKGRDGRINLPGLYESMRVLSDEERAILERQSMQSASILMQAAGLAELPGEAGYSVEERRTARPSFEVHGIIGGFTGDGAKTVIPAEARAKVSLRLTPGQAPDAILKLLQARVQELAPPGIRLDVVDLHGGDAVLLPIDDPVLGLAAAALEDEFGRPTEYIREGGSIPIVALFDRVLHIPAVMMGFGLADDNVHAPNEKFFIPNYYAAIRCVAGFLLKLGE